MSADPDTELSDRQLDLHGVPMDHVCGRCKRNRGDHADAWCRYPDTGTFPQILFGGVADDAPGRFTYQARPYLRKTSGSMPRQMPSVPVSKTIVPVNERKAELNFFKGSDAAYCACGITRSSCYYHKG